MLTGNIVQSDISPRSVMNLIFVGVVSTVVKLVDWSITPCYWTKWKSISLLLSVKMIHVAILHVRIRIWISYRVFNVMSVEISGQGGHCWFIIIVIFTWLERFESRSIVVARLSLTKPLILDPPCYYYVSFYCRNHRMVVLHHNIISGTRIKTSFVVFKECRDQQTRRSWYKM